MKGDGNNMRQKVIAGISLIAIVSVLAWVATHGKLHVTVAGGNGDGTYHYQFNDNEAEPVLDKTTGVSVSKLVSRGTYEVVVTGNGGSYVGTTQTKGFLGTQDVQAAMEAENERSFVGSNPDSCMFYTDRLISGPCGGALSDLKIHQPASSAQPSYVENLAVDNYNSSSTTTQIVETSGKLLGLTAQSQEDASGPAGYYLFTFNPNFSVAKRQLLTNLSISDAYFARPYKDGMMLYDSTMRAWYVSDASEEAQDLHIDSPKDDKLKVGLVTTAGDTITAVYTDQSTGIDTEGASAEASKGKSEVVVFKNNKNTHFIFDSVVVTAQVCGTDKLCVVSDIGLKVYDISSGELKHLYTLSGVEDFFEINNRVLAVTEQGIMTYDADKQQGYFSYLFDKYQYCGLSIASNGYLLCVTDPKGQRQALYVNPDSKDATAIDKKVAGLFATTGISNLSIYGNYLYITPNYGEGTYDWSTRTQSYDPAKKAATDTAIAQAVAKAGIDTARYQVINIGQQ